MSNFNRVVFEDGKGGLRDEESVELVEVDELDEQVRKLVMMEYHLNQQFMSLLEMIWDSPSKELLFIIASKEMTRVLLKHDMNGLRKLWNQT